MKQFIFLLSVIFISHSNYAQTEFWGVTANGGQYDAGVIFKTDSSGDNQIVEYEFHKNIGAYPGRSLLLQATDGKLYGMTQQGGLYNKGVLYQYDPVANVYLKKVDFDSVNIGGKPFGSLIQASDGYLYGYAAEGGAHGVGVMFKYNINTNTVMKLFDFDGPINGGTPQGALMQAADGMLYGMTDGGGVNDFGVLFQYNIVTNSFLKKLDFNGTVNGNSYKGALIQASDGKLYGTASGGGSSGYGVLFNYDPVTNVFTKKLDFGPANDIYLASGALFQASDGYLYGMSRFGGINSVGTLFQYNLTTNTIVKKVEFDEPTKGKWPFGALTQGTDGKLYGTTYLGGPFASQGVLFSYDPVTNIFSNKYAFSGLQGSKPSGGVIQASNGKIYGVTTSDGTASSGVLFQYDISTSTYLKKLDFEGNINGLYPQTSLFKALDGNLYGVTGNGGVYGQGVLFQYNPITHVFTKKNDFNGVAFGGYPGCSLMQASDGKLYGTTTSGGTANDGVLFQYDYSTNNLIKKVDFDEVTMGSTPIGALIQASDGKLYGLAQYGGTNGTGTLFQYNISTNALVKKNDFTGTSNGTYPKGSLLEASDGKLYGGTVLGGLTNDGVLFQYDPTISVLVKKVDFDGVSKGSGADGSFIQAANGLIYGMTDWGGINNIGVLFQYDYITNTLVKKIDFDGVSKGSKPGASLLQASNGRFYGMAGGGVFDKGVIFEYDPGSSIYTKRLDFNQVNGSSPGFVNLIEITVPKTIITLPTNTVICAGGSINVPYNVSGYYHTGNVFNAEISDALGSFVSPTNIGTSTSFWQGTIQATIPALIAAGNNYRVRVISSNPIITGSDNGSNITINTCADVWPGDANSDGTADNLDVLELGLHYTQTGAPRASVSNSWQSYFANNWSGTITNGKNLNHSDCNGDGIINDDDTLAIFNNYGLTHAFKPAQTNTVNPQLSIVPDQAMVTKGNWGTASIYLGDATTNITNINGVAFTVDFDNTLIDLNSIWIEYQNSFIDAGQNLHFQKRNSVNGRLYTATTHTTNNNVSGFGKIATLHYKISSSLFSDQVLTIGVSQANHSNATGLITPLTSGTGTLMAIGASVGVKENLYSGNVLVSPNPTNGILNISFNSIPQNTKIELYNSIGALVLSETMANKNNTISVSNLSSGIYFLKLLEGNKVVAVKKVVKE